jgi:hypothetical protein
MNPGITAGVVHSTTPHEGSRSTPWLWCSVSPYFLLLEADLAGFLAGFAFALAIAMPPSFTYTPGFHAKVREVGRLPLG